MSSLITKKEALALMEDSDNRKDSIINETNKLITDAATAGETHCSLPTKLTTKEQSWLVDFLITEGYKMENGLSMIYWR